MEKMAATVSNATEETISVGMNHSRGNGAKVSKQKGLFITVEGGEGVGKSSFCRNLYDLINEKMSLDSPPLLTREPGGTALAQAIRGLFLTPPDDEPMDVKTELLLVSAARSDHVSKKIQPALERGSWVICDRFYDSTRVYQGVMGHLNSSEMEHVISLSVCGQHPAITFLLDCDTDVSLARLDSRHRDSGSQKSRFDSATKDYHQRLRAAFLQVAREYSDRFCILDASKRPEEILEQAGVALKNRLKMMTRMGSSQ